MTDELIDHKSRVSFNFENLVLQPFDDHSHSTTLVFVSIYETGKNLIRGISKYPKVSQSIPKYPKVSQKYCPLEKLYRQQISANVHIFSCLARAWRNFIANIFWY
jgi:hypothetical protein